MAEVFSRVMLNRRGWKGEVIHICADVWRRKCCQGCRSCHERREGSWIAEELMDTMLGERPSAASSAGSSLGVTVSDAAHVQKSACILD